MQKNSRARTGSQSTSRFVCLKYVWKQIGHQLKSYKFSCLCGSSDPPYQKNLQGRSLGFCSLKSCLGDFTWRLGTAFLTWCLHFEGVETKAWLEKMSCPWEPGQGQESLRSGFSSLLSSERRTCALHGNLPFRLPASFPFRIHIFDHNLGNGMFSCIHDVCLALKEK